MGEYLLNRFSSVENFGSPSLCFDFSAPDAPCHPAKISGTNKEKRADKQIHCQSAVFVSNSLISGVLNN